MPSKRTSIPPPWCWSSRELSRRGPISSASAGRSTRRWPVDRPGAYSAPGEFNRSGRLARRGELAQHVMQNSAVLVVVEFLRRIDAQTRLEFGLLAIVGRGYDLDRLGGALVQAHHLETLPARQPEALRTLAVLVLQWQDAHADQIRPVNALEALGDDGLHAEKHRAFGGPIPRASRAVFLARQDHERRTLGLVLDGGVENRHRFAARNMQRYTAFRAGQKCIAQPDIGERPAHHDFMIAAARAVG